MRTINHPGFATVVPALIGGAYAALSVRLFDAYGLSLFLGLPLLVTFLSAFCTSFQRQVSFPTVYGRAVISLLLIGMLLIACALDGVICLVMAFPLALLFGLVGAALGHALGQACRGPAQTLLPLLLIVCFPGLVAFDSRIVELPPVRRVTTTVEVSAPMQRVWDTVVAFPRITAPPTGVFRFGIAYPVEARIDGAGVGAIRYCMFSTGDFVEPITRWEPPTLLGFNVSSNPPPMKEWSIYPDLHPAHLHGQLISRHGQFKLTQRGDKVILQGTTWYTDALAPQWYWGLVSDGIIHRIHARVLDHIREVAEHGTTPSTQGGTPPLTLKSM